MLIGRERGLSHSVQVVVLLPFFFGIFLALLQWSLDAWGQTTALAAAQEAAQVAAAVGGSKSDGVASGTAVSENGSLSNVTVEVVRGSRETVVTVSGNPVTVLWPSTVTRRATVPTERLTAP